MHESLTIVGFERTTLGPVVKNANDCPNETFKISRVGQYFRNINEVSTVVNVFIK